MPTVAELKQQIAQAESVRQSGSGLISSNINKQVDDQVARLNQQLATQTAVEGRQAGQTQLDQLTQQITDATQPYREGGEASLESFNQLLSPEGQQNFFAQYEQSPEYTRQLEGGARALEQSAVTGGSLGTGGFGKALVDYGQNLASAGGQQAYQNRLWQLQQGANFGLQGLSQQTPYQAQIGLQNANLTSGIADVNASGILGFQGLQNQQNFQNQQQQQNQQSGIYGLGGAAIGGYFGGAPGAQAGAQFGQQLGALV